MALVNLIRTTKDSTESIFHDEGYHLEVRLLGEPMDKEDYGEIIKHMTAITKIYKKLRP